MRCKSILTVLYILIVVPGNLFAQKTTFGDLIPLRYLPSAIKPSDLIDCNRYFRLADSINNLAFARTGVNLIPDYHCGNDTISYVKGSIEEAINEISPGSILARMIIDRVGAPVCCKVYMHGVDHAGKQIEEALLNLVLLPSYRNGEPIPTECRYVYDFFAPKTGRKKVID